MYSMSWIGDRYRVRAIILVGNSAISIIGLPIMAFASNTGVKYFGVFIAVAGVNANIPACMAYQANNIRGQWKRAFCSATLTGLGGIGGIAGSLVFRSQDAPRYIPGLAPVTIILLRAGQLHTSRSRRRHCSSWLVQTFFFTLHR